MAEQKQKRTYQSRHQFEVGIVAAQQLAPKPRVRVMFPDRQNLQSYWLSILVRNSQNNKDWWMPDIGEQVACLMDEAFRNGIVLGAFYQDADAPPAGVTLKDRETLMRDGAVFKYDPDAHALTVNLPAGAIAAIAVAGGGSVTYDSSGDWKIEPGAGKVLIADAFGGTQPIARIGDTVTVPNIQSGSDTATGTIVTGSSKASAGG